MILRYYGGFGGSEMILLLFIVLIVALGIAIPYLLTLHRALEVTSPEVRRMNPGQVWLLFIPLFNLFWIFQVVAAIADSFEGEYRKRGIQLPDPRPTYSVGMAYAGINVASTILSYVPAQPIKLLGGLIGLVSFVLWIVYWVKVAEHKNNLKNSMVVPPYDPNYYMQNQQGAAQQYYNQQQQYYGQQQNPYGQQQQYTPPQQPNNNPNNWQPPQNPNNNPNPWAPPQNPNDGNTPPTPPAQ